MLAPDRRLACMRNWARSVGNLARALMLMAAPLLASKPAASVEPPETIAGSAAAQAIKQEGERCYRRFREYLLANFSKAFVATGNDSCFFAHDQAMKLPL